MRLRAVQHEHKLEKRHAILDAAESLLRTDPERSTTVQELAQAAGIAKGTVYLYFPSINEVLLAVHQRHAEGFFDAFEAHCRSTDPVDMESVLRIARKTVIDEALYLPLCARINGMIEKGLPSEAVYRFKRMTAVRLTLVGELLERRIPEVGAGHGAMLLMRCYAAIIGMWMLLHPVAHLLAEYDKHGFTFYQRNFAVEAETTLRALWRGHVAQQAENH